MTSAYVDSNDELEQDVTFCAQRPSHDLEPGTRAVFYLRVSSPGHDQTDRSIAAQREACLRRVRELGFPLIDEYVDPDARPVDDQARGVPAHGRGSAVH